MFGHVVYDWEADVVVCEVPAVVCFAGGCVCDGWDAGLSDRWDVEGSGEDACASSEWIRALWLRVR